MGTRPDHSFRALAGVEVHFDRNPPQYPYGSRGVATDFYSTPAFNQELDAAFADLWTACPLGRADVIISAGAYTDKPGYHGMGRAFDLDGLFWDMLTSSDPTGRSHGAFAFVTKTAWERGGSDREFYLAVEAIMHKHFSTILDYPSAVRFPGHQDHLHIDDESNPRLFDPAWNSTAFFLQAALTWVLAIPTPITGVYDQMTRNGLHAANAGNPSDPTAWLAFMDRIARAGFGADSKEV